MGAVKGDSFTGGRWSTLEQLAHINVLELKAALFGPRSLCTHDKDVHIQLQLDNTTAVAYLNKMGRTQSRPLNDLAYENWKTKMFYAFPPFSLVPGCLQKLTQDQATGILIAPFWPTQAWFPQLLQMLYNQPWILAPSATLLQHPVQLTPHPLAKALRLMVCPVSGIVSKQKTFQKTLQISLSLMSYSLLWFVKINTELLQTRVTSKT